MEARHRRRRPLTSGKCSLCDCEASIPWKEKKYCYFHWNAIQAKDHRQNLFVRWWIKHLGGKK